jgi:hypothetical protein
MTLPSERGADTPGPQPDEAGGEQPPSLPRGGEDRIVAVVRDPESVFLHWQLGGRRSARTVREMGPGLEWVLRVLNLSDGTSRTEPLDVRAGSAYVAVQPAQTYGFELAARAGERWRTICRTERVEMPPRAPARPLTERAAGPLAPGSAAADEGARGDTAGIPGLRFESTPLHLGSSPVGPAGKGAGGPRSAARHPGRGQRHAWRSRSTRPHGPRRLP